MTPVWHTATGVADRWPCEIVIPDRDGVAGDRVQTTSSLTPHLVFFYSALSDDERIWVDYVNVYESGVDQSLRWEVRYCYAPEGWAPGPAAMTETPRGYEFMYPTGACPEGGRCDHAG